MQIIVIGAGAIGGLVAGYLKLKGQDVSLVGRVNAVEAIKEQGLKISGARGNFSVPIDICDRLISKPGLLILATKTQDIETALKENLEFIRDTAVLTTQNGIRADDIAARYIPEENIISSIVMFGATSLEPGKIVHNFGGDWIVGSAFGKNSEKINQVSDVLNEIFPTAISPAIKGMKYLKIFVNANNCIPAVLGVSMQEAFSDVQISRISMAIWKEGLGIIQKAGINLVSLPDFPLERLIKLTSLPAQEAAKIFSGIMTILSKEPLYGSILQSIKKDKPSEIDYINGEFVRLAEENHTAAPLNKKLVEMVHTVEKRRAFFSKDDLLNHTKGLVN